ncbi:MAG TPA: amidase [Gaiellaceae bacterium]|jgi:aspartyl-tRNA(Asn)/glutamyl-tRNA(Gln) amidotransferase subunit A
MSPEELRRVIDDPAVRGQVAATELVRTLLERIEKAQPRLRAFVTVRADEALAEARRIDAARAAGRRLPLDGLPVAVKDNIDVAGIPATAGSRLFAERIAASDAEVIARLRSAGAILIGKTNLHELAFGATCRNEAFGAVVNPWHAGRIPGGSSGGSGVALAADLCVGAIGTDTGGSVRLPAAFTGVTGLRPTRGAVSNRGVQPVARSLDTVGPMARSAADVAALLEAIAGFDAADPDAVEQPPPDPGALAGGVDGLRIGLPVPFFSDGLHPDVEGAVRRAAAALSELGADVREVSLPGAARAADACGLVIKVEALALHERDLANRPELFEEGTRRRLELARELTAVELARLLQLAAGWRAELRAAFRAVDLLLTPTTPGPPPASDGETVATTAAVVPFTHAFSLGEVPSLSLPCGFDRDGLPIGLQLAGPWWSDYLLLRVARRYQETTDWHLRRPAMAQPSDSISSAAVV